MYTTTYQHLLASFNQPMLAQVSADGAALFPWCGLLFNTRDCQVRRKKRRRRKTLD